MFSVFINEKEKTVKGPQSLWLFYYPHPTDKKSTRKGAEDERNQEWSQAWAGRSPLCSPLSHRGKRLLFARKGVASSVRRQRGK